MIIGTAGHIDHGKTTLVRALTGVDTDRLKEEKARGISIALGYAYAPLPNGDVLGIIDVPGHEKFVHTMAAGAVGIDHALLVVAADDGVMPQTREHLDILQLLGVTQASIALTKVDRASAAQVGAARAQLADLLGATPFAGAPVFETAASRPEDPGVAALRSHLHTLAQRMPARAQGGLFRLAVDRSFSLAGQGTVVTGTVFGGAVATGDTLVHSRTGQDLRVRSIHAQNQASERAVAGQRCALNLAGLGKDDIQRGDWIADGALLQATERIDVQLQLLATATELRQWTPVHLHLGTAHCTAHVALLEGERIEPGSCVRAQLVLDAPVFCLPGDRLILRNAQASRTIAGGSVIDPYAPARKRRSPERIAYLQALQTLVGTGRAEQLLARSPQGLPLSQLVRLSGRRWDAQDLPADCLQLPLAGDTLLLPAARWQQLRAQVLATLAQFHEKHPDEPGLNAARLRRMAWPGLVQGTHDALWRALIDGLLRDAQIAASGAWLHLPGHAVQLSAQEDVLARQLLPLIDAGRYDPPWVRDLAATTGAGEDSVRQLLRKLARRGQVFPVVKDLYYGAARMQALAQLVQELAGAHARAEVEARAFRDATGLGRKRAIQILEFFDRVGYTRRLRDAHLLRPDARWQDAAAPLQ
ncbi:selenocysteine-specific translation elongation factor [Comamonas endophytica]|uniref:Selenocysteine-specific elongation factor n=1 Tax=Comamonas endophytica TaxID=2949090 RepID=A0ABY6G8W8_9BURK|nr:MULTISPECIES: selenocysteine-specific translation elongation factor [unclassified Acidovorax]MCD2511754.1 selenocysteine-specific translation elongation factor [Acidovorax sp. D4N7]UYG51478.1 selenocysteine-specific translation elongation factor [Acidovorax sp. 5MLIR]